MIIMWSQMHPDRFTFSVKDPSSQPMANTVALKLTLCNKFSLILTVSGSGKMERKVSSRRLLDFQGD